VHEARRPTWRGGAPNAGKSGGPSLRIEKGFKPLAAGEIGLSIDDGKRVMATLQELVVKQELATYALARRVCPDCGRFRPVKDYTTRKIRTVFGPVEIENPRWMLCQRCLPHTFIAFTPVDEMCSDRATSESMELSARLGGMMPYLKAAEILVEALPVESMLARRRKT
jgi:ribosomal protein L32